MKTPKITELQWSSVDDWVRSLAQVMTNLITRISLRPRLPKGDIRAELDALGATLTEIQGERRYMAALEQVSEKIDVANAYLSDRLDRASMAATKKLDGIGQRSKSKPVRTAAFLGSFLTAVGSKTASKQAGDTLTTMLNHAEGFQNLRSLLADLRGMTDSNAPLMRLINPVKAQIDALRQDFREGVPAELARAFSRKLEREEWRQNGETDRGGLMQHEPGRRTIDPSSSPHRSSPYDIRVFNLGFS